jgi:hypothetical protein
MNRKALEHQSGPPSVFRRLFQFLILFSFVALLGLAVERTRGVLTLRHCKAQHAFPRLEDLWPAQSPTAVQFLNQFTQAVAQLPTNIPGCIGLSHTIVGSGPSLARRGSQDEIPSGEQSGMNCTWEMLGAATRDAEPAFRNLRSLLETAPSGIDYDIRKNLDSASFVSWVPVRVSGRWLQTAAVYDLHQGNLSGALENLTALANTCKLRADDPSLLSYMIRIALLGLYDSACWDALQADGWTDQQLAAFAQGCRNAPALSRLPAVFRAEQASYLHEMESFRSNPYEHWFKLREDKLVAFGRARASLRGPKASFLWNQWVRHPAWGFAWADQEAVLYLENTDNEIAAIQDGIQQASWSRLRSNLLRVRQAYVSPNARWRYFLELPLNATSSGPSLGPTAPNLWPYTDFSKAWYVTFRNLTYHHLLTTAIAIKRHELRRGKLPSSLTDLCPEFLDAVPLDLMDGQPLRYCLNPDNTYTLYSVGLDGHDDGGNPLSVDPSKSTQYNSLDGQDWVWPRLDPHPRLSQN